MRDEGGGEVCIAVLGGEREVDGELGYLAGVGGGRCGRRGG